MVGSGEGPTPEYQVPCPGLENLDRLAVTVFFWGKSSKKQGAGDPKTGASSLSLLSVYKKTVNSTLPENRAGAAQRPVEQCQA